MGYKGTTTQFSGLASLKLNLSLNWLLFIFFHRIQNQPVCKLLCSSLLAKHAFHRSITSQLWPELWYFGANGCFGSNSQKQTLLCSAKNVNFYKQYCWLASDLLPKDCSNSLSSCKMALYWMSVLQIRMNTTVVNEELGAVTRGRVPNWTVFIYKSHLIN